MHDSDVGDRLASPGIDDVGEFLLQNVNVYMLTVHACPLFTFAVII